MLEPCEGKLSRTVLRGESGSNTADLLDQTVENKQRYIGQILSEENIPRRMEEDDLTLSFAEIKAAACGNPLIKEQMELYDIHPLKMQVTNFPEIIIAESWFDLEDADICKKMRRYLKNLN